MNAPTNAKLVSKINAWARAAIRAKTDERRAELDRLMGLAVRLMALRA